MDNFADWVQIASCIFKGKAVLIPQASRALSIILTIHSRFQEYKFPVKTEQWS